MPSSTRSVIVADSSPLIALAMIDQLNLLPQLYDRVLLPPAVWDEVTVQGDGLPGAIAVRQAEWLEIKAPEISRVEALTVLVDLGEAEAIALAQSIPGSRVLLDDAQARRLAERLDVRRIGTLGVLRRAKKAGLIDEVRTCIEQLQAGGIYIRPSLVTIILQDIGEIQ